MNCTFTDLHTHILPGIDDGAADLQESLKLLRLQKSRGVERVALTPHFYPLREELDMFLKRRQQAFDLLQSCWDPDTMPQLQLGAEVHYSAQLTEMDLRCLTIGQGNYMLLELSDFSVPAHIDQVLKLIVEREITPILAHVERCVYFREEPRQLVRLIEAGALAQLSAKAFFRKDRRKFAKICLEKDVAQIIASDLHNANEAKVWLADMAETVEQERVLRAEQFAAAVWNQAQLPKYKAQPIKKSLFGYA